MPSTTFVIFGGTGDLAARKLIPALYRLYTAGRIKECSRIVGVSRMDFDDEGYRAFLKDALLSAGHAIASSGWERFAPIVRYVHADASKAEDLTGLDQAIEADPDSSGSDRLYYLALPPTAFAPVIKAMIDSGISREQPDGPLRRVVVEKPFGRDLASAKQLSETLHDCFGEHRIFRIDHYLAKETVQNIHVLRFANAVFEPVWNRNYIDSVQITVAEDLGVGSHRASYYEGAGVLRDMFQSHLLQLLALVAMEPSARFEADLLRNEKAKALSSVHPVSPESVAEASVRGQYEGYRDTEGVGAGSIVPTYGAIELFIDDWRWQGVPFYLRSGRCMTQRLTEVNVRFKRPPIAMFESVDPEELGSNHICICIQPEEAIHLSFQTKIPDEGFSMQTSELDFHYARPGGGPAPDAYERLLVDAIRGDASLFARQDEIELAWAIIDPIIQGWEGDWAPPLESYPQGSWGPTAADAFMSRRDRRWTVGCAAHQGAR